MAYLYYMKKLVFSIACALLVQTAWAQKDVLQFDENNKYVCYQVIEKPGMSMDSLYTRGLQFAGYFAPKRTEKTKVPGSVTLKDNFVIYGSALLSKKEAGEVSYKLNIDTKDGKYRYNFGEFVFKPYKINRYGNMATQPGVEIPLEKMWSKYSVKDTDAYLDQIGAFCKTASAKLIQQMDRVQVLRKQEEAVKKVATDKW